MEIVRPNVKFRDLPKPAPIPAIDRVSIAAWWVVLVATGLFWYWIAGYVGLVE